MKQTPISNRPIPQSYWVIPGRLLAGAYPGADLIEEAQKNIAALLRLGVDTFIDLTKEDGLTPYEPILKQEAARQKKNVTYTNRGIPDFEIPSQRQMAQILDLIDTRLGEGHILYLHCWGGIGRTGTVVGCYLARHGTSGQEALARIAKLRTVIADDASESPETDAQRWMVRNWPAGQ